MRTQKERALGKMRSRGSRTAAMFGWFSLMSPWLGFVLEHFHWVKIRRVAFLRERARVRFFRP